MREYGIFKVLVKMITDVESPIYKKLQNVYADSLKLILNLHKKIDKGIEKFKKYCYNDIE